MNRQKRRFIMRDGVLGGISLGVVWAIVMAWWIDPGNSFAKSLCLYTLVSVPVFAATGALSSWVFWGWMERRKKRQQERDVGSSVSDGIRDQSRPGRPLRQHDEVEHESEGLTP